LSQKLGRTYVLTVPETAQLLGISSPTVYRMIKNEEVDFYQIGRNYRISAAWVAKTLRTTVTDLLDLLEDKKDKTISA
jgi:excisionase family DNA binding protein